MIPGTYNFNIYKGGTLKTKLTGVDSLGAAVDFTDYDEIRMQIRPIWLDAVSTDDPLVELTLANGGVTKTDANLALQLNMTAAATAALTFDTGKYDLELVETGTVDVVDKFLRGTVNVVGETTV